MVIIFSTDQKDFVIPILMCPNKLRPINNMEIHCISVRTVALNSGPNVGGQITIYKYMIEGSSSLYKNNDLLQHLLLYI